MQPAAQEASLTMAMSSPRRRYLMRLGISMALYVPSLFVAKYLISRNLAEGPVVWLLGLIPGLAVLGAFYAIAMLIIEQKDEFIRMLLVRQTLIGTAIALSISTVWGFLENFGLVSHVDSYWIAVIWFLGFGFGGFINRVSHGRRVLKNRLKVLRAERNWNQQDLAERLEVSRQSVNAIETGKYDPSLPLAFRIAELFGLPIEEIFLRD
jgi:DNA-binding XRE family transcriptional regulator